VQPQLDTPNHAARVLPRAAYALYFDLYGRALSGTPQPRPRWKRALDATNGALGDAMGQMYVRRYFPSEVREQVRGMAANLVAAFGRRIDALAWTAPETRSKARVRVWVFYSSAASTACRSPGRGLSHRKGRRVRGCSNPSTAACRHRRGAGITGPVKSRW
jgi:hypothetical protein